jgi:hypothetical protein
VAKVGTPRGPTRRSHAPRKPGGDGRFSVWECVDIPRVITDFPRIVQEVCHLSEFPIGIGTKPGVHLSSVIASPRGGAIAEDDKNAVQARRPATSCQLGKEDKRAPSD